MIAIKICRYIYLQVDTATTDCGKWPLSWTAKRGVRARWGGANGLIYRWKEHCYSYFSTTPPLNERTIDRAHSLEVLLNHRVGTVHREHGDRRIRRTTRAIINEACHTCPVVLVSVVVGEVSFYNSLYLLTYARWHVARESRVSRRLMMLINFQSIPRVPTTDWLNDWVLPRDRFSWSSSVGCRCWLWGGV